MTNALPNHKVFPSLPKIPRCDVTDAFFGRNFKHQSLPRYPIFFGTMLQMYSVERTEHFGIYFWYIRRLFPRRVSPFNKAGTWID